MEKHFPLLPIWLLFMVLYKWLYALDMMLPISLVFAFIATIVELIRSNALDLFLCPWLFSNEGTCSHSFCCYHCLDLLYIAAHTTSFARANEYADNLRESSQFLTPTNNLFFTHEGNYIFFGTLNPLSQKAQSIRIFTFENGKLKEALSAEEAYYRGSLLEYSACSY